MSQKSKCGRFVMSDGVIAEHVSIEEFGYNGVK